MEQSLLQILHHYNVLHLSSNLMQLSLSTICGNHCNIKSISGLYSTALPHYHSSFEWERDRPSLCVCERDQKERRVNFKIIYNTIISLWALNIKAQYFRDMLQSKNHIDCFFFIILID